MNKLLGVLFISLAGGSAAYAGSSNSDLAFDKRAHIGDMKLAVDSRNTGPDMTGTGTKTNAGSNSASDSSPAGNTDMETSSDARSRSGKNSKSGMTKDKTRRSSSEKIDGGGVARPGTGDQSGGNDVGKDIPTGGTPFGTSRPNKGTGSSSGSSGSSSGSMSR